MWLRKLLIPLEFFLFTFLSVYTIIIVWKHEITTLTPTPCRIFTRTPMASVLAARNSGMPGTQPITVASKPYGTISSMLLIVRLRPSARFSRKRLLNSISRFAASWRPSLVRLARMRFAISTTSTTRKEAKSGSSTNSVCRMVISLVH